MDSLSQHIYHCKFKAPQKAFSQQRKWSSRDRDKGNGANVDEIYASSHPQSTKGVLTALSKALGRSTAKQGAIGKQGKQKTSSSRYFPNSIVKKAKVEQKSMLNSL